MKISCPSCSAKYSIADDKVLNRLAKIRCRKCGTTIVIDGKNDPPVVRAADGPGRDDDGRSTGATSVAPVATPAGQAGGGAAGVYTVDIADNDQRSMSVADIVEAYNTGAITADTFVWREGMADWESLAEVAEINLALHEAAAAPAARLSAEPREAAVRAEDPSRAAGNYAGQSLLEPKRAATRAEVGRDLFGGIDVAGSEFDTRTSVAGQDPAQKGGPATGARNESSVLFSLSALTSGPDAGPSKSSATKDDSGLIDLAALAALAPKSSSFDDRLDAAGLISSAAAGGAPLGVAPLGAGAPPLGSVEAPKSQSSGRGAMFIGGGIAIAAIVASLAYVLKEEPPAVTVAAPAVVSAAAVSAGSPENPAAAVDTAPTTKPETDKPAAAGETAKDKPAATGPKPVYRPRPAAPKPAAPAAAEKEKPAAKPAAESGDKAAPPKKKCNCAPSDLMCAMRCSAK